MGSFTDNAGTVWNIKITYSDVERVKNHVLGADGKPLDLFDIAERGDFSGISGSVRKVIEVVFWLCYSKISEQSGKTVPQECMDWFGERIGGDEIVAMVEAWEAAILNFIPNRQIRQAVKNVAEKQRALQTAIFQKAEEGCLRSITAGHAKLSGDLPASLESIPTDTPSEN